MRYCFSPLSIPIPQSFEEKNNLREDQAIPQSTAISQIHYLLLCHRYFCLTFCQTHLSLRRTLTTLFLSLSPSLSFTISVALALSISPSYPLTPMYWAQLWAAFNHINVPTARHFSQNFLHSTSVPSALVAPLRSPPPRTPYSPNHVLSEASPCSYFIRHFLPASFLRFAFFLFFLFFFFSNDFL